MVWRWVGESTHSFWELCLLFGNGCGNRRIHRGALCLLFGDRCVNRRIHWGELCMGGEIDAFIGGIVFTVWRWVGESTHSLGELCLLFGGGWGNRLIPPHSIVLMVWRWVGESTLSLEELR